MPCDVYGVQNLKDLVILYMEYIDIILGMSWLFLYYSILDRYDKTINIAMPGMEK